MVAFLAITIWCLMSFFTLCVQGVSIPDRSCTLANDCQQTPWATPYPECVNHECQCPNGTCLVYTKDGGSFEYYCGECGVLGSECNNTIPCELLICDESDNFCHCERGDVHREICVIYTPIPTTLTSVILIVVLVILLIVLRLIKSWDKIHGFFCRRCSSAASVQSTVVGINPYSGEKSAAYTITNADFMVTSNDSDLEWAMEFSRQMQTQRDEDWLSMGSLTWSSSSSSNRNRSSGTTSRHRVQAQSTPLEPIAEPGTSGHGDNTSRQRTTASTRQRSSLRSSVSTDVSSRVSSIRSSSNHPTFPRSSRSSTTSSISFQFMEPSSRRGSTAHASSLSSRSRNTSSSTQTSRSSSRSARTSVSFQDESNRSSGESTRSSQSRESTRSSQSRESIRSSQSRESTRSSQSRESTRSSQSGPSSFSSSNRSSTSSAPTAVPSTLSSKAFSLMRFFSMTTFQATNKSLVDSTSEQNEVDASPQLDSACNSESYDASASSSETNSIRSIPTDC